MNEKLPPEPDTHISTEYSDERKTWGERTQNIAAVLWTSFLAASLATLLFFAFVDPALMGDAMTPTMSFGRMTGYAIGFFFFWLITSISSLLSVYLVCTRRNAG